MKNSYTEKQIEIENLLRSVTSEGVPSDVIDEITTLVGESEQKINESENLQENFESIIKMKLLETTDWKKRASLMALLISKSLE